MNTSPADSPLSKADLANLQRTMYNLNSAVLEIGRAEAAGLDMTEEKLRHHDLRTRVEALLKAYGPSS